MRRPIGGRNTSAAGFHGFRKSIKTDASTDPLAPSVPLPQPEGHWLLAPVAGWLRSTLAACPAAGSAELALVTGA